MKNLLRIFICFVCSNSLISQEKKSINLYGLETTINGDTVLNFNNSFQDESISKNKIYFEKIPITNYNDILNTSNLKFKTLSEAHFNYVNKKSLNKTIDFNYNLVTEGSEKFIYLYFDPFVIDDLGKISYLQSFDVDFENKTIQHEKNKFVDNSVLSSGIFYKIGVTNTGVYEINYEFLLSNGIDPSIINPKNISIYGNPAGQLEEGSYEIDDLEELSIEVISQNDDTFSISDKIIFYGQSQLKSKYEEGKFNFEKNIYSDTTFYFLSFGNIEGKRVEFIESNNFDKVDYVVDKFDEYYHYENDFFNLVNTGRQWFGESFAFNQVQEFSFSSQKIDLTEPIYFSANFAARSSSTTSFSIFNNGTLIDDPTIQPVSSNSNVFYKSSVSENIFYADSESLDLQIIYNNNGNSSSQSWLDYFSFNFRSNLIFNGTQFNFRDVNSVGIDNYTKFTIIAQDQNPLIWDVTNPVSPKEIQTTTKSSSIEFISSTEILKEFVVFNNSDNFFPVSIEIIPNQNLHGSQSPEFIIVTHPNFIQAANRLAQYHTQKNNTSVLVATTDQVYNEFGSGSQDITAIRNFVKMFYDRAQSVEERPKNILLFGDASFDYKNKIDGLSNFVPTFETTVSNNIQSSFCTDDYFAALDDTDGAWNGGLNNSIYTDKLDIGVGRIPVNTLSDANLFVDKIMHYDSESLGLWKNKICFVADDADATWESSLITHADALAEKIDTSYGMFNIDKIYIDSYPQSFNSGSQRYPEAQEDITGVVQDGALVINYVGHGGEIGWASERILELSDINNFTNFNKLPVFITATCEFTRYDDLDRVSAGEYLLLNPNGGAVGLFSTSRTVGESPTYNLVNSLYNFLPDRENDMSFGEVLTATKNDSSLSLNTVKRRFSFFGDPNMKLSFPEYKIITQSVELVDSTGQTILSNVSNTQDTINSLSHVLVKGYVAEIDSTLIDFNGFMDVVVYDKAKKFTTLNNDGFLNEPFEYFLQKNIIYNGQVDVINGLFQIEFVVPKDINYEFGVGKFSFYANDPLIGEATGFNKKIVIGGISNNYLSDEIGPEINLFMNDENFISGGYTNPTPTLLAKLFDDSGINTVGTGIGHDLTLILDENTSNQIILNEYYQSDLNSFKSGKVIFPFSELDEGSHTLTFKAWDVHNNSNSEFLEFFVISSNNIEIGELFNYPNPCSGFTNFIFEHNRPDELVEATLDIFSFDGNIVKSFNSSEISTGFRNNVLWQINGSLKSGIYIYRLTLKSQFDDSITQKSDKLIIVR